MSITQPEIDAFLNMWDKLQNWQFGGARLETVKAVDSEGVTFESAAPDFAGYEVETTKVSWAEIVGRSA